MGIFSKVFGSYSTRELARIEPLKKKVLELDEEYQALSDADLKEKTNEFRERLEDGESLESMEAEALATVREAAYRVLGKKPFPVQIIGAIVLHQGRIAEMKTGEGKTLVACVAAYLNALTGKGVHVVTVNDYLAKTQSDEMGKVLRYLGLTVGCILHGLTNDQRRAAYNCDVTYGTNNELGFDYLRDNMVIYKKDKVQREHNFAIVDEVDSILIDEARTPLIISGKGDKSTALYGVVDKFAKTLTAATVVEMDDKQDQEEINENADYIVDEKSKTATITRRGVKKAEEYFAVENLMDPENMTLLHHVNQALKANGVMRKDIDYIVEDGEVVIIDEFTGRKMLGRRFNDGLHQAIEAKEGVEVAQESKTLATITFQNYFRLYTKLSGMTGTAMTEEDEFREIYKLDVIAIPTNRPVQRIDHTDLIYRTEKGKYKAIIEQIAECHEKGQPVLVGTISIEKSELLSSMLKRKGIKHEVLNAKYHAKEAEIVAQAGKLGAVTIATNMAGRGTDIMLGGNAEFLAKAEMRKREYPEEIITEAIGYADTDNQEVLDARAVYQELYKKFGEEVKEKAQAVKEAGGLYILGTERHESRRIDNQLRGRSGRQGDEGESRFFLSVEDDLMRIFAGDRLENMMRTLNVDEDTPIESKALTKIIESSQRKVEGRNFNIRKNVLNYDDVMNTQREIIYKQRAQVLDGEDIHDSILKMFEELIAGTVKQYINEEETDHNQWNLVGLRDHFLGWITEEGDLEYDETDLAGLTTADITEALTEKAKSLYAAKEEEFGSEVMRELERVVLLKVVDTKWMAHIDDMDELKKGIGLRAYGQQNPVVEYRYEGFEMFDAMVDSIREDTVRMLLTVRLQKNQAPEREQVSKPDAPNAGAGDGSFGGQRRSAKKK
ncbi:preprotein translocase subunit SecA [Ruminococcus callidus]|jgi:preprotein translocase subunit SecA|uniref:preprotein translocase subunit SecA n=2 Tax=Ruminococcus callidus TaxID=40519 RepID=UPI000EE736CB|nr:preprotein translocase subunit SecA [Ruminococcus callidus]MDY3655501.1 preprotein translocase subunit SecA [Ruminococcus callidus]HCD40183.1 preprotein translocase subunit SecA [Ruminococcus sp.]HCY35217.1 preprotein translocase subunit SecA [Ruminococcus sp.]